MKKIDQPNAKAVSNANSIPESTNLYDLSNSQLPADYNAMNWEEFFAIFKQRQPALYNKFVNK